ncbi:MAG: hypothetical protein G01um101466_772 [Parcubacteria group bacterium Gr01-1014_66]|nr:MAG: hypothetical protein G01um101466_772 [Parcubacteria group bacterium Gr01-1014_66]
MKIRVIATPHGDTDEIRTEWIGCEMPCTGIRNSGYRIYSNTPCFGLYYVVSVQDAIQALARVNSEAATFWEMTAAQYKISNFLFARDVVCDSRGIEVKNKSRASE